MTEEQSDLVEELVFKAHVQMCPHGVSLSWRDCPSRLCQEVYAMLSVYGYLDRGGRDAIGA